MCNFVGKTIKLKKKKTQLLFLNEKSSKRPQLRVYLLTSVARNSSVIAVNNSVFNWDLGVDTGTFYWKESENAKSVEAVINSFRPPGCYKCIIREF